MARPKKNKDLELIDSQYEIEKNEKSYIDTKVNDMLQEIEKNKENLANEMIEYAKNHEVECKWDREGDPIEWKVDLSPIVITNKFFKPIIPINYQEPIYNAETLSMVYDCYCQILAEVNDKIGHFPTSLSLFCRFAGLTMYSLRRLRQSEDYNIRVIVEKIYDQIGDENLSMSQLGITKERTTLFKLKSQNEMVEKAQPNVNINANIVDVDFDRIQERLEKYSQYSNKKKK